MTSQDLKHENFAPLRVFDSSGMYLFTCCFFAVVALAKLLHIGKDAARLAGPPSNFQRVIVVLGTLYLAAYLPILLRRISNRVEQLAIVLLEISCVLWLAKFLATVGAGWAKIPYSDQLQTIVACLVAILAAVCWLQIAQESTRSQWRSRRLTQGGVDFAVVVRRFEEFAGLGAVGGADEAVALHHVDKVGGAAIADTQPAL